jgi:hypothetical protein
MGVKNIDGKLHVSGDLEVDGAIKFQDADGSILGDDYTRLKAEVNGEVTIVTLECNESNTTVTLQNLTGDDIVVDWGDGAVGAEWTHAYTKKGQYKCKIYGATALGTADGTSIFSFDGIENDSVRMGLVDIIVSNKVTSIGSYALKTPSTIPFEKAIIPSSVRNFYTESFGTCNTVYIKSTSPPTIGGLNTFNSSTKILVPKGCKPTYREFAGAWRDYVSQMYEDCQYIIDVNADGTLNIITI